MAAALGAAAGRDAHRLSRRGRHRRRGARPGRHRHRAGRAGRARAVPGARPGARPAASLRAVRGLGRHGRGDVRRRCHDLDRSFLAHAATDADVSSTPDGTVGAPARSAHTGDHAHEHDHAARAQAGVIMRPIASHHPTVAQQAGGRPARRGDQGGDRRYATLDAAIAAGYELPRPGRAPTSTWRTRRTRRTAGCSTRSGRRCWSTRSTGAGRRCSAWSS